MYQDLKDISRGIVMAGSGGAINSNISNLLAWAKSGTGDSLLTEEMIKLRHQYTTPISVISYGIAQYKYDHPDAEFLFNCYGHSRDAFGYSAQAYRNDDYGGASIAAASNSCSISSDVLVRLIEVFADELQARNGTEGMAPTVVDVSPTDSPTVVSGAAVPTEVPTPSSSAGHLRVFMWWCFSAAIMFASAFALS
jgi:hypothetical protein